MDRLILPRPDDWHLHLRDGAAMADVLPHTVARFGRAIVMPNLQPPVVTVGQAALYRDRIRAALPAGAHFTPLMTLYLTDNTDPDEVDRAVEAGFVKAVKLYPAGATTNSDAGVTDLARVDAVLDRMAARGLPLLLHGEVTAGEVDIFDREAVFLEQVLAPLLARHPGLRVVLEHITTAAAAAFVAAGPARLGATITPQHLVATRNDLLVGGVKPHYYCLPVLKRERDRQALVAAATSGDPRFFLGTDSAPHPVAAKESACGCAGCFTACGALELYAEAFEAAGALHRLAGFASRHGADFYGLPVAEDTVTLVREPWTLPESLPFGDGVVRPFRAGEVLAWRLVRAG